MTIGTGFPEVLAAAQAGAGWALETIYRDLAAVVIGYLRGQGAAEPEDLASEVFVAVVRDVRRFRGDEAAFRSWLFTIAHRRLIDERRGRGRRPEEPASLATLASAMAPGDTESEAMDRLGGGWVFEAMDRLTADQRAVVLLRVLGDLSVADVALVLGKAEGAIKTLQRRALKQLAKHVPPDAR